MANNTGKKYGGRQKGRPNRQLLYQLGNSFIKLLKGCLNSYTTLALR